MGIALSDPCNSYAMPHSTLERKGRSIYGNIVAVAESNNIGSIVVGLPYELDGAIGDQAEKVLVFIEELKKRLVGKPQLRDIPVEIFDERMTTAQAEKLIQGTRLKNKDKSAALDQVAAALILDAFLAFSKMK